MGGPSSADYKRQSDISQGQLDLSKQSQDQATKDLQQRETLMKPAISFNTAITNGSRDARLAATAPLISQISTAGVQAKSKIMNSLPPGAARDVALADVDRETQNNIASSNNQSYTTALDKLANIGNGLGSFSLSETGAALGASQAGAQTEGAVIQGKAQKKASTMNAIGSLVGAAGTAAGGGVFGKL